MELFEKENLLKHILAEIQKTDELVHDFKDELAEALYPVIESYHPTVVRSAAIDDVVFAYAVALFNSVESVIDKDRNYPAYRFNDELAAMNQLLLKLPVDNDHLPFMEAVMKKGKELMVKYNRGVYDLSGNGFRLLEMNAKLYNWEFISNLTAVL